MSMSRMLDPKAAEQEESHWLSVSDLMAGLMMVFLFIAIALMRDAMVKTAQVKDVAVAYQENQVAIYEALIHEFEPDLERWDAVIDDESLTFTFQSPDVLFAQGQVTISAQYSELLADFFPRYINVLSNFTDSINEVRIEGHTSSIWNTSVSETEAYFLNMALSQGRTRSVLEYVYSLSSVSEYKPWIKQNFAAVGFSSAKAIIEDGLENQDRSRRVTFRVITNADIQMRRILEMN